MPSFCGWSTGPGVLFLVDLPKEGSSTKKVILTQNIRSKICVRENKDSHTSGAVFVFLVGFEYLIGISAPPPSVPPIKKEGCKKASVRENKLFFPGRVGIIGTGLDINPYDR